MPAFAILVAAFVPPATAFAFPLHSTARTALALSIFYWTILVVVIAWMAKVNYALTTRVEGTTLRILTVGGRRTIDLTSLDRIRSFSMYGNYGGAHTLRLHTRDGAHAMVIADMSLASLNRKNVEREHQVRAALAPYADLADDRARWWLRVGPRPPRLASARHILAMMVLFMLGCVGLLIVLVAYLAVALY